MKETLKEALTSKHFQMVADTIKAIEDPKRRSELAKHHAEIFAKSNPRFDHKRFMAAANVQEEVELDEVAKWRTNPKAHTRNDPDEAEDSRDVDYYYDNPKSTGYKTPVGSQKQDPLKYAHPFNKSFDTLKIGPRAGKIRASDQRSKKGEIHRRIGKHHTPTLPESLAYEG